MHLHLLRYVIFAAALFFSLISLSNILAAASESPGNNYESASYVSFSATAILWTIFYAMA